MSEVVERAKLKVKRAYDACLTVYEKARDDLFFLSDDPCAQWNDGDYNRRIRQQRPTLTVDQLSQFVNQVTNNVRQNTPAINVIAKGSGADADTAAIFKGLIRDIEHRSGADDAYDLALNFAVKCSIGFIRIDHDYTDDVGFEQELRIKRVVDPLSIFLDADSIEPDGRDAKCGFILESMHKNKYNARFPKASEVSFQFEGHVEPAEDHILVCEYYEIEEEEKTIAQLRNGEVVEFVKGMDAVATRVITRRKVRRYILNGEEEIESGYFPGKYIPIVPVYGEEAWQNGKREVHSLIRKAKDAQRMYNYWKSMETELLMKQPKATFLVAAGQVEDYAEDWLNPDKAMVLRYNSKDVDGQPINPPVPLPPPSIPAGILQASMGAVDDIKATMGLYNAFLGQRSNESSGVAINARKIEGERAVYHYGDNLVRSINHVGEILVSAIPEVYDTPRMVAVIGDEDLSDEVGINGMRAEGQKRDYDLTKGQYNVRVTTGSSFATARQEAAAFYEKIIQTNPELINVIGDLVFKYMDFPGAQSVSDRLKRTIPPQILGEGDEDPQVAAVNAQNQQLQAAIQQLQGEAQMLQQQLKSKQDEIQIKMQSEAAKNDTERSKQEVEVMKLRVEEQKIASDYEIKQQEIALKARELTLKEQELALKAREQAQQSVVAANEVPQSSDI